MTDKAPPLVDKCIPTADELNEMGANSNATVPQNGKRYLVLIGLKKHGFDKESYWTIGHRFGDKWLSCWDGPELNYVTDWRDLPPAPAHPKLRA